MYERSAGFHPVSLEAASSVFLSTFGTNIAEFRIRCDNLIMAPPDHLERRNHRLKSLDEFEPLPWHQKRRENTRIKLTVLVMAGLAIGGSIGWLLAA